jgi:hypothetical protein
LGGVLESGMKVITNPNHPSSSKDYTFQEIVPGKGVRVSETDALLGTGWLYTRQELKLR